MSRSFDRTTPDWLRKLNMPLAARSLAVWAKADVSSVTQRLLVAAQFQGIPPSQVGSFRLYRGSSNRILALVTDAGGATGATTSTSVGAGEWFHAVATIDGTDISVYLNGGGKGTNPHSEAVRDWRRHSVAADWDGSNPFDGQIAHVAAWDFALTDAQVLALYEGRCPPMDIGVVVGQLLYYAPLEHDDLCQFGEGVAGSQLVWGTQNSPTFVDDEPNVLPMIGGIVAA